MAYLGLAPWVVAVNRALKHGWQVRVIAQDYVSLVLRRPTGPRALRIAVWASGAVCRMP
jgi:hypothetical protein